MAATSVELWPLLAYLAAVLALVAALLGLGHWLGGRHRRSARAADEPFESGIVPTGSARVRFAAHFYLVAMFFVIFDLEAVFVIAWAIAAREAGWAGYVEVLVFIGILLAALVYLWRVGALEWGSRGRRPAPPGHWTRPRDAEREGESACAGG